MSRPFIIKMRKKGFKHWKETGTVHNTKPSAEKYAKKTRELFKTPNITMETKTKMMSIKHFGQYKEQLRKTREYNRKKRRS